MFCTDAKHPFKSVQTSYSDPVTQKYKLSFPELKLGVCLRAVLLRGLWRWYPITALSSFCRSLVPLASGLSLSRSAVSIIRFLLIGSNCHISFSG